MNNRPYVFMQLKMVYSSQLEIPKAREFDLTDLSRKIVHKLFHNFKKLFQVEAEDIAKNII